MSQERYDRLKDALRFQRDHFHETPAVIVACYELSAWTGRLRRQWRQFADSTRRLGARRRSATLAAGAAGVQRALGGGQRVPRRPESPAGGAGAWAWPRR